MDFELLGKKISISEGQRNYMEIFTHFQAMAEQAEREFRQEYDSTLGTVFFKSNYAEKFKRTYGSDDYMDKIVMRYVAKTRKFLSKYGIYDLSDSTIWNEGVVTEEREVSRLQYEFNSFIGDCLYAVEEADGDDDMFISKLQSKFSGSFFPTCLYNDVMGLCDFVLNYLNKNKIVDVQFVYKQDAEKARAIFANLEDTVLTDSEQVDILMDIPQGLSETQFMEEYQKRVGPDIPKEEKEKLAVSLIELNWREDQYYEFIFENFPQARYEIAAIAKYLSIDISDLIEKEIRRSCDLKSIASEEDALQMMADLQEMMARFGVTQTSRLDELKAILQDFDVKARTYDGVLYDSRELCKKASEDDCTLYELHGNVDSLDKQTCNEYLRQIVQMPIVHAIKQKHLTILNERVVCLDKEHLEGLLGGLDSLDEEACNCLKTTIKQYDTAEEIKSPFLTRVEKRIYAIWDAEDFEKFTEIYTQTQVSNSEQIGKNSAIISESGRTDSKELFINALKLLNDDEVMAAAKYAVAKESGMFASLINMGKKASYVILTLNGTVMHPAILNAMEAVRAKKSNGILANLGFGKNKAKSQPAQQQGVSAKFCSACGTPVDGASKFCSKCGNKLG